MRLHQFMHAVEPEVDVGHLAWSHGRAKTLLCVAAIDPAGFQAVIVCRLVIVDMLSGVVIEAVCDTVHTYCGPRFVQPVSHQKRVAWRCPDQLGETSASARLRWTSILAFSICRPASPGWH